MPRPIRHCVLLLSCVALSVFPLRAQENSGWRISPEKINIQVGADRRLQVLDESAQEVEGAVWSVDDASLAEIRQEEGHVVLRAKDRGTVRVSAALGNETRYLDIKIWPEADRLPPGTTNWSMHPIGRDVGDIPAVPTEDGPELYSLEQTPSGSTYLRAVEPDGIQMWTWLIPEKTYDVELICGDWLGGAVLSATRSDSYTLYVVGRDGHLRWQHTSPGVRKALAISTDHLAYLLSQSRDATSASLAVFDEASGADKFELAVPASHQNLVSLRHDGRKFVCAANSVSTPSPAAISRVYVNMDGYAYIAFSQSEQTMGTSKCVPGAAIDPSQVRLTREDSLILWQIHKDGTYRNIPVDSVRREQPLSGPVETLSPTGAIVTDNMNGTLIPVQVRHARGAAPDEFVYRINAEGDLVYKFPLPKYAGPLHDEMVIGNNDTGFATRGGTLIAFNAREGTEMWRWDSHTQEISVFAALADGGCAVQTPTALVEVLGGVESKEIMKGKAMMSWNGQMYRKNQ
jgi:outer membrane protein assembly factor BamB